VVVFRWRKQLAIKEMGFYMWGFFRMIAVFVFLFFSFLFFFNMYQGAFYFFNMFFKMSFKLFFI
jgi:hypothetical protein